MLDDIYDQTQMAAASEAMIAKYEQSGRTGGNPRTKKRRPGLSFNANLPFQVHQEFQALTQQIKNSLPLEKKHDCTMTNWIVAAIETVIIPAQKKQLAEMRGQGDLYKNQAA